MADGPSSSTEPNSGPPLALVPATATEERDSAPEGSSRERMTATKGPDTRHLDRDVAPALGVGEQPASTTNTTEIPENSPLGQAASETIQPPTSIPEVAKLADTTVGASDRLAADLDNTIDDSILNPVLPPPEIITNDNSDQTQLNDALLSAAYGGNKLEFNRLLQQGAEITAKRANRETALHLASRGGYLEIVKDILQNHKEIGINEIDDDGWTALIGATRNDEIEVVKELLKYRPVVSIKDEDNRTALYCAALYGNGAIVRKLLEYLKDRSYLDGEKDDGYTALHQASRDGDTGAVELLTNPNGMTLDQINSIDNDGYTALFRAAERDPEEREEIVTRLLSRGAKIIPPRNHGWKPPGDISYSKDGLLMRQMFRYYLEDDDDDVDDKHWTPLHRAVHKGLDLVVGKLLDDGAVPKKSKSGQTPLGLAASEGRSKVVKVLLEKRNKDVRRFSQGLIGISPKNAEIQAAFLISIKKMDVDTVQQFLLALSDAELEGFEDDEAIEDWAEKKEKTYVTHEVVKRLLRVKKSKQRKKVENRLDEVLERAKWQALHWAVYHGRPVVVLSLLKSGKFEEKVTNEAEEMARIILRDIRLNTNVGRGTTERNQNPALKDGSASINGPENEQDTARSIDLAAAHAIDERQREQQSDEAEEKRYTATLEMLRFSGMLLDTAEVKTSESEKQYEKPKSEFNNLIPFKASIIDFYKQDDKRASYLRQTHDIHTVIYGEGPKSLMEKALKTLKQGERNVSPYEPDERKLRWIHLPANNMEWMNDLVMRLCYDKDKKHTNELEFFSLDTFLQRSFQQLPSGQSGRRYMKPNCVRDSYIPKKPERKRSGSANSDDTALREQYRRRRARTVSRTRSLDSSRASSTSRRASSTFKRREKERESPVQRLALYMPFLNFGELTKPGKRHMSIYPGSDRGRQGSSKENTKQSEDNEGEDADLTGNMNTGQDGNLDVPRQSLQRQSPLRQSLQRDNQKPNERLLSISGHVLPQPQKPIEQDVEATRLNLLEQEQRVDATRVDYLVRPEYENEPDEDKEGPVVFENEAYQQLFDMYHGKVVHGTRTLDESYYHSLSHTDVQRRNVDQVVTRRVHSGLKLNQKKPWTILRVDQLWLWVVDNDTIVTSATHRIDNSEDPVIESIWRHLRDGRGNGKGSAPPSTAEEMSEFIMEFCVGFFDTASSQVGKTKESIHQIFENSINEMAIREAALFNEFSKKVRHTIIDLKNERDAIYGRDMKQNKKEGPMLDGAQAVLGNNSNESQESVASSHVDLQRVNTNTHELEHSGITGHDNKKKKRPDKGNDDRRTRDEIISNLQSISDAADLLMEIKDIRDELKMLKAVFVDQRKVWNDFKGEIPIESPLEVQLRGPANYIINEIKEMDDTAERIQSAINSILDLEQNEASISEAMSSRKQAEESIQQGRTLMVFTVVTIIFLPMSFLVSFFALNITSFPHSSGSLLYSPGWIYPRIFGVTSAISVLLIVAAFYIDKLRAIFREHRELWRSKDQSTTNKAIPNLLSFLKTSSKADISKRRQSTLNKDSAVHADRIEQHKGEGSADLHAQKDTNARLHSIRERFNARWSPPAVHSSSNGANGVSWSEDVWTQSGILEKGSG